MKLFQPILCLFGKHARGARSHVWHDGNHYRSTCPGCGVPMIRDVHGWRTLTNEERASEPPHRPGH